MNERTIYKCRAECPADATRAEQALAEDARDFAVTHTNGLPDVEVTFASSLPLATLRAVLSAVPEGHVMAETLAPHDAFNGERSRYAAHPSLAN